MKLRLLDLRPTQIAVGMREVEFKIKRLKELKDSKLEEYLAAHPVPVIKSPHDELYIIDHHHLVRACWELGFEKVLTEQKADLSHLTHDEFWKVMVQSHWIHPYDQFGKGPHAPELLPHSIRGLADDPFRSLAWAVREGGGFKKCDKPFVEFHWADFFRKSIKLGMSRKDFETAVEHALKLAKSPQAKGLPGHHDGD